MSTALTATRPVGFLRSALLTLSTSRLPIAIAAILALAATGAAGYAQEDHDRPGHDRESEGEGEGEHVGADQDGGEHGGERGAAGVEVEYEEQAPPAAGVALPSDGPIYPVGEIDLRYLRENPLHPSLEDAMQTSVTLGRTETGYVAPRDDVPLVTYTVEEIDMREVEAYHASAIQHLLEALRDYFVGQDLLGVYVAPDPRQIDQNGMDLRPRGETRFYIVVTTGILTELRTAGSGDRVVEKGDIEPEERIDHPLHARIKGRSPFQPYREGDPEEERSDLLKKSELDRYLFHLGRHPGRRVDAGVAAAEEVGGIALDYMVTENRPLVLYAQASNTGTRETDYWRQHFGLLHTQLSDNDDVFSLDYTTASFEDVHAVSASYERPFENDRVHWRAYGSWSQYTASDVGFFNDVFKGESWQIGGEVLWNFYQKRELFLDLVGGIHFDNIEVNNNFFGIEGQEQFLFPYVGVRLDRTTEWFSTRADLTFEAKLGDLTDVDDNELVRLGRTNPDRDWVVMGWNLSHSFYLEPALDREAWEDPSTPESSTLAHELSLSFRGQYAFDKRLIPQEEYVVGGLYTVRGYPQSIVAGDTAVIGSLEYRFHLPRALAINPSPGELFGGTFRSAPQYVYGTPDWDLVLKGFFDVGYSVISDREFFEEDESLMGAGVGVDFIYRRNLNIRLDWGFILDEIESRQANSGSNRLHVVATILF